MLEWFFQPSFQRYLIAIAFVSTGLLHFLKTGFFLKIMPDYIPYHKAMVLISGVAEIFGGIGLIVPSMRRVSVYGLLLLLAVFPANIDMAVKAYKNHGLTPYTWLLLFRLPLQFVLMYWVYWAGTGVN